MCVYIYIYMQMHACYIHTLCVYMYVCMYVYIYIYITGVLETGVFGIVEMCLGLMRTVVFRDHEARVFASRSNIFQVTRKPLFLKPLFIEPQT